MAGPKVENHERVFLAVLLGLFGLGGIYHVASEYGVHIKFLPDLFSVFVNSLGLATRTFAKVPFDLFIRFTLYYPKILWCFAATWLGIAKWLWTTRGEFDESLLEMFCTYTIFMPLAIGSLVYGIAFRIDPSFNASFHVFGLSLGLILGFLGKDLSRVVRR